MQVGSRHLPQYERATLENLNRVQVRQRAMNLQDALGVSHIQLPFAKDDMIEWIIQNQSERFESAQAKILNSVSPGPEISHRSDFTVTASTIASPGSQGRGSGGYPSRESESGSYFPESAHSPRSGRFDPNGVWEMSSSIIGSTRRMESQVKDKRQWVESEDHERTQKAAHKSALEQLRRINNVHKTEKQQRLLRKVVSQALMGGDPIPAKDLEILVDAFRLHRYSPGDVIIQEGDYLDDMDPGLFVAETGTLGVYKGINPNIRHDPVNRSRYGKKVFQFSKVGATMGELSLHYGAPRSASIIAESDDVIMWSIARVSLSPQVKESAERRKVASLTNIMNVPIFASLGENQARKLLDNMEIVRYRRGDPVISQGQMGSTLFILEQGNCLACRQRESLSALTLKHYHPGDYFGELALLQDVPRAADIIVESQAATLLVLDRDKFREIMGELTVGIKRLEVQTIVDAQGRRTSKEMNFQQTRSSDRIIPNSYIGQGEKTAAGMSLKEVIEKKSILHPKQEKEESISSRDSRGGKKETGKVRLLGTSNAPKKWQQEELLQQMLASGFFGNDVPSKEDLIQLASTFMMHRVEPGTVLLKEGDNPVDEDPLVFMLEFGDIGVYKQNRWLPGSKTQGRPHLKGYGVRITFYNKPGEYVTQWAPLNNAPPTASMVCDQRSGVISMNRQVYNKLIHRAMKQRQKACMQILQQVHFLHELTREEMDTILNVLGTYQFQKGDFVSQSGEVSNVMYIIESGRCASYAKGRRLKVHEQGECMAEIALIEDTLRSADIVVDSPEATLLGLKRADFNELIGKLVIKVKTRAQGVEVPSMAIGESGESPPPHGLQDEHEESTTPRGAASPQKGSQRVQFGGRNSTQ